MDSSSSSPGQPSFQELFTPKLVTVLKEGYDLQAFRADALAGVTVAIVALPLSMAIAIASGLSPDQGLYTAIVGGFLISALGGSRFQIGGPAGAFIILVAATVQEHGVDGLILATMLAGAILMAIGFLRLGTYIKFIPLPVTVGFTAGIATIILVSQLSELLGIHLGETHAGDLVQTIQALADALPATNPAALALATGTIVLIWATKLVRPGWPSMLIAVILASAAATLFSLPVDTIGSRFGGIPSSLPWPSFPELSLQKILAVLPDAVAFALLGAIEALLSAVVADGMTGRRHRSNCELVAQGVANIACASVGGTVATGTIARTATNVRAGGRSPIAGMIHALVLLGFVVMAAPLASYIPLAALAGVLVVVAWTMAEKNEVWALIRSSRGDALVVLATLLLTVFQGLTEGIVVGVALGSLLFIHRMAESAEIERGEALIQDDIADDATGPRKAYDAGLATDPDIVVYRIKGAFFFGAASTVGAVLDRIADRHRVFILDFTAVPLVDSTAANTVAGFARKAARQNVRFYATGTSTAMQRILIAHGAGPPLIDFLPNIDAALKAGRRERDEA